jgi:hypothetical protein
MAAENGMSWGKAFMWMGVGGVVVGGCTIGGLIAFDWVRTEDERKAAQAAAKAKTKAAGG